MTPAFTQSPSKKADVPSLETAFDPRQKLLAATPVETAKVRDGLAKFVATVRGLDDLSAAGMKDALDKLRARRLVESNPTEAVELSRKIVDLPRTVRENAGFVAERINSCFAEFVQTPLFTWLKAAAAFSEKSMANARRAEAEFSKTTGVLVEGTALTRRAQELVSEVGRLQTIFDRIRDSSLERNLCGVNLAPFQNFFAVD